MSLGELIDSIKELLVQYFHGKVDEVNKIVDEIRGDIKIVSDEIDETTGAVNDIRGEIAQIKSGLNDGVQGELGEIKESLDNKFDNLKAELEGKFNGLHSGLEGKFGDVDNRFSEINNKVEEILKIYHDELNQLREEVKEIPVLKIKIDDTQSALTQAQQTIESQNSEIGRLTDGLNGANERISELETNLKTETDNLEKTRDDLEVEKRSSADTKDELQAWKDAVKIYAPVRDAIKNCETFNRILDERGLNDDSELGLFAFVQELGKTIDFVRDIHKTALDAKKRQGNQPQLMTPEEIAVYSALNKCYRAIWNIDFDIFTSPGSRKPIDDPFEKFPFNKDEAIFFKDFRNKTLKYTQGIYIPMLLTRERKMYMQAYVDAGNL